MTAIGITAPPVADRAARARRTRAAPARVARRRRVARRCRRAALPAVVALERLADHRRRRRARVARAGAPARASFTTVTVTAGDSLWSIAEEVAPSADPRESSMRSSRLNALDGVDDLGGPAARDPGASTRAASLTRVALRWEG